MLFFLVICLAYIQPAMPILLGAFYFNRLIKLIRIIRSSANQIAYLIYNIACL